MMRLSEAAAMLGVPFAGEDAEVLRISTDSRTIRPGDLFIALRGEKFDGGRFAAQALEQGAVGVVLDPAQAPDVTAAIRVDDTRLALGRLAAAWRQRFAVPVVAITGSNGKTTVKEMLAAILRAEAGSDTAVLHTEGNLNNDIGLPLMLLRLRETHQYAVLEMGMNHAGEIDYLTRLARPDVAVVNNALSAHIGFLGSIENIARAKGEIFNGLSDTGIAVFNADDPHAGLWREANARRCVIDFGLRQPAAVRGHYQPGDFGSALTLTLPNATLDVALQVPGEHNAMNALAAAAAAFALDISHRSIVAGLSGFGGVKGRLQKKPALHGSTFIDDTYNANPDSVKAALAVLAQQAGKKVLVLGDMGELGSDAAAMHAQIGQAARVAGVDRLLALGELTKETVGAFGAGAMHFERIQELLAELENALMPDTTVLVKGSRFMQMERVVNSFMEDPAPSQPGHEGH
ncbi:UDP-N-acetylmuramoyl-tripeptide--D-alanyl-D-alanine ligase [Thiobacillus sp.]|uniref:UDP-N-acetylmuramoyl-tripeptide--D-alanyl-D- alanine ligase n=1 Tax=Thiobacillus sp. TaxID=924 RepID=UPI0018350204|nr:UDP-N-acetylmuramoyl-tripeptide--D-alanyl-D-alanine ligase [Thiobacillus sp.]MBC2729700.1 UDP-N-acetylmuramoyl-tripeptide--D-alanyl-D-alanine ligase [Thiobacillus sp.]MBC2738435.1 UDP-N-acetylmuramoyl-tripeptide--D-alanyl-D-alanine ligase [Thiobacillus sp.]MBC2761284.1 UDP-N-acetylmuramoyl-tripeptide--D-alanyl-D-alanine ligase [Thiobacillus sp.]